MDAKTIRVINTSAQFLRMLIYYYSRGDLLVLFLHSCILSLVFENGFSNKTSGEVWKITLNLTSNVKISDLMECSRKFQYICI